MVANEYGTYMMYENMADEWKYFFFVERNEREKIGEPTRSNNVNMIITSSVFAAYCGIIAYSKVLE